MAGRAPGARFRPAAPRVSCRRVRKFLYMPFGIVAGIVAGRLSRQLVDRLWASAAQEPGPPSPRSGEATVPKVVAAAALEGATFAATKAAVDRATASGFQRFFGVWPEKTRAEKQAEQDRKDAEKAAKRLEKTLKR